MHTAHTYGWSVDQVNLALLIIAISEAPAIWMAYASIDWENVGRRSARILTTCAVMYVCV